MMKKLSLLLVFLISITINGHAQDIIKTVEGDIIIQPITHGTLVLTFNNKTIYIDPYGGAQSFDGIVKPDFILITDIHNDHLNIKTLEGLNTKKTQFIVPKAVADKMPEKYKKQLTILNNNQSIHRSGLYISAIPMYNLPEDEESRHPKGRGNGYIINMGGKNIYISGDTEDISEMRNLRDIDVAFICMNLPYTMDIYQASSAVLEFKPTIIYPFHYRGADVDAFKKIVNDGDKSIDIRLRDWYPNK